MLDHTSENLYFRTVTIWRPVWNFASDVVIIDGLSLFQVIRTRSISFSQDDLQKADLSEA